MKKHDHITVLHIYSSSDSGKNRPQRLMDEYETECVGNFHRSRYNIVFKNYNDLEETSVKETLVDISRGEFEEVVKPDFLVLGFSGWKYQKDGSRNEPMSVGSTTDFCMRTIRNPIVIVKKECREGPKNFVMTVNGSNASKVGLDILFTLLGPDDHLTVVTLYEHAHVDESIEEYYTHELRERCPAKHFKFEPVRRVGNDNLHDTLNDYLENLEQDVDFLVIAPRTRDDKIFSSFTDRIIQDVKTNIILCKV